MQLAELALALDALALYVNDDSLARWNDHPSRTQERVAGALDAAAGVASDRLRVPRAGVTELTHRTPR